MNEAEMKDLIAAVERVAMVLGAVYAGQMGELEQSNKAQGLSCCGFSNTEIARLLGTRPNTIRVALHRSRKRASKGKKKTAPSATKPGD